MRATLVLAACIALGCLSACGGDDSAAGDNGEGGREATAGKCGTAASGRSPAMSCHATSGISGGAGSSGKCGIPASGMSPAMSCHPVAGASGGAGHGGAAAVVMCGNTTCTVNATLLSINPMAQACCTTDNKCGQQTSTGACLPKLAPGAEDKSCPDVQVMVGAMSYPQAGRCTPQGQCGGNFMSVEWGCVARQDCAADMGGPLTAQTCGANTDHDAGVDAGL